MLRKCKLAMVLKKKGNYSYLSFLQPYFFKFNYTLPMSYHFSYYSIHYSCYLYYCFHSNYSYLSSCYYSISYCSCKISFQPFCLVHLLKPLQISGSELLLSVLNILIHLQHLCHQHISLLIFHT